MVYQRYWSDKVNDMVRQRRKQAEFLVYQSCPWSLIQEIGVLNAPAKTRVDEILGEFEASRRPVVNLRAAWYY
jgi:hypothetical protein